MLMGSGSYSFRLWHPTWNGNQLENELFKVLDAPTWCRANRFGFEVILNLIHIMLINHRTAAAPIALSSLYGSELQLFDRLCSAFQPIPLKIAALRACQVNFAPKMYRIYVRV
jgi:hypothetical protein